MAIFSIIALVIVCLVASWLMTSSVRRYALRANLLDRPNERSSHSFPTPRGGGVAIVASFLLLVVALAFTQRIGAALAAALVGAGALVATLGFIDDRGHVSARWRFLGHATAAVWVMCWLGPLPAVPLLGVRVDLAFAAVLLSAFYIVWSINFFNFMDGIDGLASLEAIGVALGGALVWWIDQPQGDWPLAILFAACVAGFLCWNFPSARIFMGDAGSGFIGLVIAVLSLWSGRAGPHLFWAWFILVGCFMVDATLTLIRRVRRGERFHEAHRSHAYQYASRVHRSHKAVSLAVAAINTFWLLPVAVAVALNWIDGVVAVLVAYAPLVVLALRYKAGDRAAQGAAA